MFPVIFGFLTTAAPEGVTVMTDISKYLDFVIVMFFAFGTAFEIPVATFMLVKMGIATRQDLVEKRPYVVVGVFVVAAILTPPDPVSQTLMAVQMCALWEIGLLFCKWFIEEEEEDEEDEAQAAALAALPAHERDEQRRKQRSAGVARKGDREGRRLCRHPKSFAFVRSLALSG